MELHELTWLAGLLEGEGCFILNSRRKNPNHRKSIQVSLAMSDEDVVRRAAALMGTTVNVMREARGTHSKMWRTLASSQKAEDLMLAVRPHMGERRGAKIDAILAEENLSHR